MASGWGGRRSGSGPKVGPDGKALKPYKRRNASKEASQSSRTPTTDGEVAKVPAAPRTMFSTESVAMILDAMKEQQTRSRMRRRTKEWNPYVINANKFGPSAIEAKAAKLAMDDNTALMSANNFAVQAWQSGGMLPNDASEGMLFLGYSYLSELTQRPEFRLFGEIMSEEMTRKWIDFRGTDDESIEEKDKPKSRNNDDDEADQRRIAAGGKPRSDNRNKEIESKIKELRDFADELKLRHVFKTLAAHDSQFGIGHLYLDLKGANIDNPRDPENSKSIGTGRDAISREKLRTGCLAGLRTIEPIWCYPTAYNASNPLSPSWYDPQVWFVMGAEIHKTRLIPLVGRPVPDILKPAYCFGGISMTQLAQPYVDIWLRTRESVGELIHAFSVMILQTNMSTTTQPGGAGFGGGDVLARMMLANMMRDNQGMMVIDKASEDFKNISAPISGLDELQAQAQEHMFSVGRIPAVKFAGIQPKGLNATSDGEMRAFNDTVHGQQEHLFRSGLTTVLDIMQISLWGERDPDITYDFLPLHEETPKEKAEIRKIEAETDQIRIDSGVVSQEEVRSKVVTDPESGFHGLDPDDVPDLAEEEADGLMPGGKKPGEGGSGGEGDDDGGGDRGGGSGRASDEDLDDEEDAEDNDFTLFDGALDEGSFEEGKHPRKADGKFAPKGGGGGSGGPAAAGEEGSEGGPSGKSPYDKFKPHELVKHLLEKPAIAGGNYRRALLKAIKSPQAADDEKKKLATKLVESWVKTGKNAYDKGDMKSAGKISEKITALIKEHSLDKDVGNVKAEGASQPAKAAEKTKPESKPKPKQEAPKPEPKTLGQQSLAQMFPPPNEQELSQAKKNVPLKLSYVPGDKPSGIYAPVAQKMVDEFNEKYAGKTLTDNAELAEKVAHFKTMKEGINGLAKAEQKATAEEKAAAIAKAQAAAKKKADEEAKKAADEAQKNAERNKKFILELGISEKQAEGMSALAKMLGKSGTDLIGDFKQYETQAKNLGYPISGFQCALIKNYSNGGYHAINDALRKGAWTPAQHAYVSMANKALDAMPKHTGKCVRGAQLTPEQIASYPEGHIIQESAFMSTASHGEGFGRNVKFHITAIGKRGASIQKLSNYPGENEVLFQARTFFKVSKVENKGGKTEIHLEEWEEH